MTEDEIQRAAMNCFLALGLSYRFTVTRLEEPPTRGPVRLRFMFSKPTPQKPEPEITVTMDVEIAHETKDTLEYALYFEGQKYQRRLVVGRSGPLEDCDFNERQIDKIYLQKAALRQRQLWR